MKNNWFVLRKEIFADYYENHGLGSVVDIATGYGPGIESQWGRDFSYLYRPTLVPTQHPIQRIPALSRG